jgi:hypothetical protein
LRLANSSGQSWDSSAVLYIKGPSSSFFSTYSLPNYRAKKWEEEIVTDILKGGYGASRINSEVNMKILAFRPSDALDVFGPASNLLSVLCLIFFATATAHPNPNDLRWRFSDTTNDLRSVAYGNGTIIAVGNNGTILSSIDTVKWSPRASGATHTLRGIAYGNQLFVAVGGDNGSLVLTSSDNGASWDKQHPPTSNVLHAVTYGENRFVAVGDAGTILVSTDGISWTRRPTGFTKALLAAGYRLPSASESLFVAAGEDGAIFTSPDAQAWTLRNSGVLLDLNCVATVGTRNWDAVSLIAAGQEGIAVGSADGISWSAIALPTDTDLYAAAGAGAVGNAARALFVLAGGNGTYLTSADGYSWSTQPPGTFANFRGLSTLDGGVVSVADAGTIRCGLAWFRRVSGTTSMLHGAVHAAGMYVVVGEQGTLLTSVDGVHWTPNGSGLPSLNDVTYGAGRFVAVGEDLKISVSTNGVEWTSIQLPVPSDAACCFRTLAEVAYGNGAFIATGYYARAPSGVYRPLLAFSTDGLAWRTTTNTPAAYRGYLLHPGAGLGQFLLGGVGLFSSPDGETWTEGVAGIYFGSLAFAPDRAFALSEAGWIARSTDGIHWDVDSLTPEISGEMMAYSGGALITAWRQNGITTVASSVDGIDWDVGVLFDGILHLTDSRAFLVRGDNCFVTGGLNGLILQSPPLILPPQLSAGYNRLSLASEPGVELEIQTSTNLIDWGTWRTMTVEQHTTEIELSGSDQANRFFRAIIAQP